MTNYIALIDFIDLHPIIPMAEDLEFGKHSVAM